MQITESGTLHHTCFVVRDVERTAAALAQSGIGPWGVWTIEPTASTVRDKKLASPSGSRSRRWGRELRTASAE